LATDIGLVTVFFILFLTSNMENLSQLVTQEDYLGLQVLRIKHHCYGLVLNTSRLVAVLDFYASSRIWSEF
jgi:hypothetical protein